MVKLCGICEIKEWEKGDCGSENIGYGILGVKEKEIEVK